MKLRLTLRAGENLSVILNYLQSRSPQASRRVRRTILSTFRNLLLFPEAGRMLRHDLRKIVTPRYGYVIYYLADRAADEVVIVAVLHAAQQRHPDDI
jgi:plasmid stabilization system protein ParE